PIVGSLAFFFSSRRRHTRFSRDWSSDVCSSDLWISRCCQVPTRRGRQSPSKFANSRLAYRETCHVSNEEPTIEDVKPDQGLCGRSEERRVGKEGRCQWARPP